MSKIEWTDVTWNPVTGCSKVSEGCKNCYAEKISHRFKWTNKPWNTAHAEDNVKLHPDRLEQPLTWKKPRRVFVNSMSDLFHEQVPDDFIWRVFEIMAQSPHHMFQILTKRPQRMADMLTGRFWRNLGTSYRPFFAKIIKGEHWEGDTPFLPNVWLGVSVENQKVAEERIPLLLQTPAAVRFLSCEPLLGSIDLRLRESELYITTGWKPPLSNYTEVGEFIDWVIVGGESGPGARPMHPDWARSLRDQCRDARIPFFFKQWGEWEPIDQPWKQENPKYLARNEQWLNHEGGQGFHGEEVWRMRRIGKKKAGRLLDGRECNEIPGSNHF